MKITTTHLSGIAVLEPTVFGDERGFFLESYNKNSLDKALDEKLEFVQDNHSKSAVNVLRGLHYQIHQAQGKLVRVTAGEVFDVVVDIRRSSPTLGQWFGINLSAANKKQLWIPPGFAHGFMVLSDGTEFLYKTTDYYAPEHERCIIWDDPDINISWPLIDGQAPLLSDKDKIGNYLKEAEIFS